MRQLIRLNLFDLVDWHDDNYRELSSLLSQDDLIYLILIGLINSDLLDFPCELKETIVTAFYYRYNVNVCEDFENKLFNYILKCVRRVIGQIVINLSYHSDFGYLINEGSIYIYFME